jgi:hypothetical protein
LHESVFIASGIGQDGYYPTPCLRTDLVEFILGFGQTAGGEEFEGASLADIAHAIVKAFHSQLEWFATSGQGVVEDFTVHFELFHRACVKACARAGASFPDLDFSSPEDFRQFWKRNDMSGSYALRRQYLEGVFGELERELLKKKRLNWTDSLASPITPRGRTDWPEVDAEVEELKRKFGVATSSQDYSGIGQACVRIQEAAIDAAFNPATHMPSSGEPIPSRAMTKRRVDLILSSNHSGSESELLRKLVRSAIEFAQDTKHRTTPNRRDAGIAADATILVVNLLRRITGD